jgi:hypothetical protein
MSKRDLLMSKRDLLALAYLNDAFANSVVRLEEFVRVNHIIHRPHLYIYTYMNIEEFVRVSHIIHRPHYSYIYNIYIFM